MALQSIIRAGAYSAVLAPLLSVATLVTFLIVVGGGKISDAAGSPGFYFAGGLMLASVVALIPALMSFLLASAERLGSLGVTGFLLALVGTVLAAGGSWTYLFVVPEIAERAPAIANTGQGSVLAGFVISYSLAAVGWIVFGLALQRARVHPRWSVYLLIAGAAIAFLPLPSRTLVLAIAVGYLGLRMIREGAGRPSPAAEVAAVAVGS